MPIDIAMLATTVVTSFLIPRATKILGKISDEVTEKVSELAANRVTEIAETVWNKVKALFSAPKDEAVFSQLEENPDESKDLIIKMLKKKLEENPQFAQELNELINGSTSTGNQTAAQIMNAGIAGILDARGMHLTGSGNKLSGVNIEIPAQDKTSNDK